MYKYFLPLFICLISLTACSKKRNLSAKKTKPNAVYLVRHADRDKGVDGLNDKGNERAKLLAEKLKDQHIQAIYCTKYNRTQETAAPLAQILGIEPIIYDAGDFESIVQLIKDKHKSQTVLVVGHSNTIPSIINTFGYEPAMADLEHHEYSKLFYLEYGDELKVEIIQLGEKDSH